MIHISRNSESAPTSGQGERASQSRGTQKLVQHLARKGHRFEVLNHPPTETALDEAGELRVPAGSVVKALLVHSSLRGTMLVAIPASHRLDINLLREAIEDPDARLASENEITRLFPWAELGALPPMGS